MIPILWSYPYKYVNKKELLFNISIISHLSDNSIKLLKDENIIESNFKNKIFYLIILDFVNIIIIFMRFFQIK
jgi:hypothetical protein